MKAEFVVKVEGDWWVNGKRVTARLIEKALRQAAKDEFEYLAKSVTVKLKSSSSTLKEIK